jgi:hypothetical protein
MLAFSGKSVILLTYTAFGGAPQNAVAEFQKSITGGKNH